MNIHSINRVFMRYFRRRRLTQLRDLLPILQEGIRILDVGGGWGYPWDALDSPADITVLNVKHTGESLRSSRRTYVEGDGRYLQYGDKSFDVVFSNSVIEHVGGLQDQIRFANELQRVGKHLYLQTPNKWFFVEPHLITCFLHWLPMSIQRRLVRWCSIWGLVTKPSQKQVDEFLNGIRLLTLSEVRQMFPGCVIHFEKFMGMSKSFIVVRRD